MNNFKEQITSNWKPILWGLIPFIIIVIILAIPFKTVPIQETETYWDTEMRSEPYTASESYTETERYMAIETKTETVYDGYASPSNWSYTFTTDEPDTTVSINLTGYSYYAYSPPLYWVSGNHTRFWPWDNYWNRSSTSRAVIKVSYPEEVTKYRDVTKYQEVVKYREVPTQVLKEKKVTKYVKMSIWAYLFLDQSQ